MNRRKQFESIILREKWKRKWGKKIYYFKFKCYLIRFKKLTEALILFGGGGELQKNN